MRHQHGVAGLAAAAIALSVAGGGVVAGTRPTSQSAAPRSAPSAPSASLAEDARIERRVDALLAKMTTREKLQQVQLLADFQITDAEARAGVGGVFSLVDPERINHFQHVAVEQSRLHIPILFAYDTIHGYRTVFPVPLGTASSFDRSVARADAV